MDQLRAQERPRQQRTREQAPDAGGRVALEDQSRPHPHHPHARLLSLEAVEQALHLGLVAGVEGRRNAGGGPVLVDPAVLGPGRVGPHRRGVHERRGAGAAAAAWNTRRLPSTFTRQVACRSRPGWISQARCTTASAPANTCSRGARATSAALHSTLGKRMPGMRRATPTTLSTAGSSASALSTLVPTLPLAPVTTTRMGRSMPPLTPPQTPGRVPPSPGNGPSARAHARSRRQQPPAVAWRSR